MRKLLSTAVAFGVISSASLFNSLYAVDVPSTMLPKLSSSDNATVTTPSTGYMNIKIGKEVQGEVGTLNWSTYNIGSDATVNYEFSAHNQTALNQVAQSGGMSQIYGKITNSGCNGCGFAGTGKIILLNPNGVFFGEGANVDVNSFTVSTMKGDFNKKTNTLTLENYSDQTKNGIVVEDKATIHADKGVTFASRNIALHKGSKISTNTGINVDDTSYGKVKLVTSDGVNFTYYNNGAVQGLGAETSTGQMTLSIDGSEITSGHIDARNMSTDKDSELIVTGGSKLKAVKAIKGNDGNIWLTANNRLITDNSSFTTDNASGAANVPGGNILMQSNQKTTLNTDTVNAVGNVTLTANDAGNSYAYKDKDGNNWENDGNVNVDNTTIITPKDVIVKASKGVASKNQYGIASVQNKSNITANNVTIEGAERGQVTRNSKVTATNDINLKSNNSIAWTNSNSALKAGNDINISAPNSYALLQNTKNEAGNNINVTTKSTISSERIGTSEFVAGKDVNLTSGNNIELNSLEPFQPEDGKLNLDATNNIIIAKDAALKVADIDVNFKAGKDIELTSNNNSLTLDGSKITFEKAQNIKLTGDVNVKTKEDTTLNLNNIKTIITANRGDIDVTLDGVGEQARSKGLVAKAEKGDVTITTEGALSVSDLRSGKDMTINADSIIAGLDYTDEEKLPVDTTTKRSYIEVGGKFTSNVKNYNFEGENDTTGNGATIQSGDLTDDGAYNQRHHIQYGENGEEKILLVNKRPVEDVDDPTINDPNRGKETGADDPFGNGDDQPGDDQHGDDQHGDDQHGDDQHGDDQHGDDQPGSDEQGCAKPKAGDAVTGENPPKMQ